VKEIQILEPLKSSGRIGKHHGRRKRFYLDEVEHEHDDSKPGMQAVEVLNMAIEVELVCS